MTTRAPHGWQDPEQFAAPVEPPDGWVQESHWDGERWHFGRWIDLNTDVPAPRHDRRWLVLLIVLAALIWRKRL